MTTPPTVVNLDLCKMCEKRVGTDSFLADLQSILSEVEFVPAYYIPFGVGTIVDIIIDNNLKSIILINS